MQKPTPYQVKIEKKEQLTKTVYAIECSLQNPTELHFEPGQYGTFIITPTIRRQYSFCSDASKQKIASFVIDTMPGGPGSQYFVSCKEGDIVTMLAPLGNFVCNTSATEHIFVATGTGIAPFRSMIYQLGNSAKISLYWGLRHEEDVYWQSFLEEQQKMNPLFSYHIVISKPKDAWEGLRGHVTEHVLHYHGGTDAHYYLCGNKEMIKEVHNGLIEKSIIAQQISSELF